MKRLFKRGFVTIVLTFAFVMSCVMVSSATIYPKQTAATQTSATIKWSAVSGAARYEVWYYPANNQSKITKKNARTKTQYKITLPKGKSYYAEIGAFDSYGNLIDYSYMLFIQPAPGKVTKVKPYSWSINGKNGNFKLSKNPYPNIMEGIQWKILTRNGKKVKAKGTTTYMSFSAKVPSNQVYKLMVRGYSQPGGKKFYGPWYKKTIVPEPKMNKAKLVKGTKVKLSWRKVKGATKYVVYASTSRNKGYKKVATVKKNKNSVVISKVKGKKLKKYKSYYFQVQAVAGKNKSTRSVYQDVFIYTVYK